MSRAHFVSLVLAKMTPLLLATLGGLFSELSGVINFALEGMMLAGAFGAVWGSFVSGSPWVGLAAGAGAGAFIGLLHATTCLGLRANQIVSSIALNLLAVGMTGMLLHQVFQAYGTSPSVATIPTLGQMGLGRLPLIGTALAAFFGPLPVLVPVALILALALVVFFHRSVWGLRVQACGENPLAATAAGLSVFRIRFAAVVISGALAGSGGAYLAIGELSQFVENMTHGRGYLAIATLILARWRPSGIILAAFFFGFVEALSEWFAVLWPSFPYQTFLAFPYFACLIVLMGQIGKREPPSSLGK